MTKTDYKKTMKQIYAPSSETPSIIQIPQMTHATLSGIGNPNTSKDFSDSIAALYALCYTISMSYKNDDFAIPDFHNFVVPPLEGVWSIVEGSEYSVDNKDNLKWTIGILQPDFVTEDVFARAKRIACDNKKNPLIENISLTTYNDGMCCTYLHRGSFDSEKASFDMMEAFAIEKGYKRIEKVHREIYLSNFNKVDTDKLKTVLRFKVAKT